MTELDELHRPNLLPRFSLLTVFLLTTIVAMAITIALLWRDVRPLRADNRRLRDEVGELAIDDPMKIHAIQVRTKEDLVWKWRVWVPEGVSVNAHCQWGKVPRVGLPPSNNSLLITSGEHWIELSARKDRDNKNWEGSLATDGASIGTIIQPDEHWFDWHGSTSVSGGVNFSTVAEKDSRESFILQRYRTSQAPNSAAVQKSDEPAVGFIIWVDRQ